MQQITTTYKSDIQDSSSVSKQEEEFMLSSSNSPDSATEPIDVDSTTKSILQNSNSITNNSDPNQPWSESANQ